MANFSDTFTYTLIITLFGMGIVFIVLILLQYILKSMELVSRREKKTASSSNQVSEVKTVETAAAQMNDAEAADDDQLVAVITAAVISCLGGKSNIVVRNIRRIDDLTPAWGKVSRTEQMANRF